ncbi:response regulator [uncultured Mailhella sp.]|uniref:response regulator n=1 Tax=uncultured Mailhella sp. TaxID=1981031 RepID=UPI00261BF74F|nr:response regulator [uncultured Mailhella sp.]
MEKNSKRFLLASIVAAVFCVGVCIHTAIVMTRQGENATRELGDIYMDAVNFQMQLRFYAVVDQKLRQLENIINVTPPEEVPSYSEEMKDRLRSRARVRTFCYQSLMTTEGNEEILLGEHVELLDKMSFLRSLNNGERNVTIGVTKNGSRILVMGTSVGYPASAGYPMSNGETCTAMLGGISFKYLTNALSVGSSDENMPAPQIITKTGDILFSGTASVSEQNYFEWVRKNGNVEGQTAERLADSLKANISRGRDYDVFMYLDGQRHRVHYSQLPHTEWYLVTDMPYGTLDTVISKLWGERLYTAVRAGVLLALPLLLLLLYYLHLSRRQIANLTQARKEADKASRAKTDFLSNMSHDIRTPMNAIMGLTAIASSNPDDDELVRDCLRKISLSSQHLLGLINDVLDMSKIEGGKLMLNVNVVSLRDVMDGVVGIAQPQVTAKNQDFDIHIHDILTESVYSDSVRLHQVLLNLVSNAIKFTPPGGSIQISLHQEPIPGQDDTVRNHIEVRDTGIGMSAEFQKKVFEPFARENNDLVHKTEGTGLGMAITKHIVDEMKGTITVHSEPNKGTEFHIILDTRRADGSEDEKMILPPRHVLLVDDDETLCYTATRALQELGVTVESAPDGMTAISMATRNHEEGCDYDIILLDWKMPGLDGIETARQLNSLLKPKVPVLLISSYDWAKIEEAARNAGVSGFIPKPLFKSTLFYGLRPFMGLQNEPKEEAAPQEEKKYSSSHILLVEDNELNWEIANVLLSERGFILDWAENGKAGVEKFSASKPGYYDLVLMDVRMPVMNGYEAARAIRALDRPDANIPIIAMTADAFSDDVQKCLESGMNAHVSKPLDIRLLMQVIHKYVAEEYQPMDA